MQKLTSNLSAAKCRTRIFTISVFRIFKKYRYRLLGLCIILGGWELLAVVVASPLLVPHLHDIFFSLVSLFSLRISYIYIFFTILRICVVLIVSLLLAVSFGLLAGLNPKAEKLFFAAETILRTLPTVALILLALIWFRSNLTPVFVASLVSLPLLYRDMADAIKNIDPRLTEMSADFEVPFQTRLRFLYLPHCLFAMRTSLVSAIGLTVKVLVMSELMSQPKYGIGTAFQIAKSQLDTGAIFAWGIISVLLAAFLQSVFRLIMRLRRRGTYAP